YKGPASIFSMVKDFSWNQDSLSCIKSMVDNRIAVLYQILHTAGRRVKRTLPGNLICHIMGQVKSHICCPQPYFLRNWFIQMIFPDLGILIEISLSDNICHSGLNNLESVLFQISFNIMVCPRMEIQQIFTYDQYSGFRMRPVIFYLIHNVYSFLKAMSGSHYPMFFQTIYYLVQSFFKSLIC